MGMTFQLYWGRKILKNAHLLDEDKAMTIKVSSFKKELEKAYRAGQLETWKPNASKDGLEKLFGDLFK